MLMGNIQVKHVPDALLRRIRRAAAEEGRTIRDFVLEAVRAKISRDEFFTRIAKRTPVVLDRPAADAVDEVRAERERERGR